MEIETISQKKCSRCGEVKPISEFYRKTSSKNGRQDCCKACSKEYVASRRSTPAPPYQAGNNPLASVTPRQLMIELARRGFTGDLHFDRKVTIERLR